MASVLTTLIGELAATKNHVQSVTRCNALLSEIETKFEKRTIFYFASEVGADVSSMINDEDVFVIENLLSVPSDKHDLVLVLHSNGGFSLSAERIIEVCRNYCKQRNDGSQFYVFIPKKAKSAATILALGADKIFLRDTAELGPVDPQFSVTDANGNTSSIPVYLQVDAIENLLPNSNSLFAWIQEWFAGTKPFSRLPADIRLKLFEQCNYPLYLNGKNELGLSDSIIEKIADAIILRHPDIKRTDFDIFRDPHITKSHSRLINLFDLRDSSLTVAGVINKAETILGTPANYPALDVLIWELYVRKRQLLNDGGHQIVKTIESSSEFFTNSGRKLGQPKSS